MKKLFCFAIVVLSFVSAFGHTEMKVDSLPDNAYSVKLGEKAWTISTKFHGSGLYWGWIVVTNPHLFPGGLQDPKVHEDTIHNMIIVDLFPGDILYIVPKDELLARMGLTEKEFLSLSPNDMDCSLYIASTPQDSILETQPVEIPEIIPTEPLVAHGDKDTVHKNTPVVVTPVSTDSLCADTVNTNENATALLATNLPLVKDTSTTDTATTVENTAIAPILNDDKGVNNSNNNKSPENTGNENSWAGKKDLFEVLMILTVIAVMMIAFIVIVDRKKQFAEYQVNGPMKNLMKKMKEHPEVAILGAVAKWPIVDERINPEDQDTVTKVAERNMKTWISKNSYAIHKHDEVVIEKVAHVNISALPGELGEVFHEGGHPFGEILLDGKEGFLAKVVIIKMDISYVDGNRENFKPENIHKTEIARKSDSFFFLRQYGNLVIPVEKDEALSSTIKYDEITEVYRINPEDVKLKRVS